MFSPSFILFFLSLLSSISYGFQTKEFDERRIGEGMTPKIVGGVVVDPPFKYPWIVSLSFLDNHYCGGSVIDSTHILTAAHCVIDPMYPMEFISVQVHRHDLTASPTDEGAQIRGVAKMVVHPNFFRTRIGPANDIAVWTLDSPLNSVAPIALDRNGLDYDDDETEARIMGWGTIYSNGPASTLLLHTNISLVSSYQCSLDYRGLIPTTMLCAGTPEGGKDTCQGDSDKFSLIILILSFLFNGVYSLYYILFIYSLINSFFFFFSLPLRGPLVINADTNPVQVGVVSFGKGCGDKNFPGVYARVSEFIDFVDKAIVDGIFSLFVFYFFFFFSFF